MEAACKFVVIVVEGLPTMIDIVFLVCQVCSFDVLGEECCDGVIKPVIGLIELGGNLIPIISGSSIQACWITQLNGPITAPLSLEQQQG